MLNHLITMIKIMNLSFIYFVLHEFHRESNHAHQALIKERTEKAIIKEIRKTQKQRIQKTTLMKAILRALKTTQTIFLNTPDEEQKIQYTLKNIDESNKIHDYILHKEVTHKETGQQTHLNTTEK